MDSIWINPGKVKTSDEEGWRGHGVVRSEGGMGNRAHSPELVVARILILTHVLVVARCGSAASSIHDTLLVSSFSFYFMIFTFFSFLLIQSKFFTKSRECVRRGVDRK